MPDDHIYQQVMAHLLIDPEKVSAEAKRITASRADERLDTAEHRAVTAKKKRKPSGPGTRTTESKPAAEGERHD